VFYLFDYAETAIAIVGISRCKVTPQKVFSTHRVELRQGFHSDFVKKVVSLKGIGK